MNLKQFPHLNDKAFKKSSQKTRYCGRYMFLAVHTTSQHNKWIVGAHMKGLDNSDLICLQ